MSIVPCSIQQVLLLIYFIYGGLVTKSCLTLVTPWTLAGQAPLSMGFSRQEYWGGLPFPSPGDLPNPEIEPESPALQADCLPTEPPGKPFWYMCVIYLNLLACVYHEGYIW